MSRLPYVINLIDYKDFAVIKTFTVIFFTVCRMAKKVILDVARPDLEGKGGESSIMRGGKLNGNKGSYCWENRLW